MQEQGRIARLVDRLSDWISYLFLIIVAITAYEVVMRYCFNAPTIWVHELAVALAATGFVLGGPLVLQREQHIAIAVIYDRLRPRAQRFARAINSLLALVFCALLSYAALRQAGVALEARETSGTALNWPIPLYLKTLFALAAVVMTLQSVAHLARDLRRLRARSGQ